MNGECKSYRLNDPMAWKEFRPMPDDIKVTYIKLLRQKYNPPVTQIAKMMGVTEATVRRELEQLNLTDGKKRSGRMKWDKEGFWAWVNGVDKVPAPAVEEPTQEEKEAIFFGEEKGYVEDDLPFEEPEAVVEEDSPCVELYQGQGKEAFGSIHPSQAELELLKAKEESAWLRNENESLRMNIRILEAQMDVVRLIFGGRNHG